MTYVVTEAASNANIPTVLKSARWTASTRVRTCWSSIRTNASIAGVCERMPPTPSSRNRAGSGKMDRGEYRICQDLPNITQKKDPRLTPGFRGYEGKFEKFFLRRLERAIDRGRIEYSLNRFPPKSGGGLTLISSDRRNRPDNAPEGP